MTKQDDKEKEPTKKKGKEPATTSGFIKDLMDASEHLFGENNFMARDSEKYALGIPLEHISLMYLFSINILPLSKILGIAGPAGCNKSSLGFAFNRMILDYGGFYSILECEGGKISPHLLRSVVGDHNMDSNRIMVSLCESIDKAQGGLLKQTQVSIDKDPGRSIPFGLMVDSLTGTDTEADSAKVVEEGYAGKAFPAGALSWTRFFKTYAAQLTSLPVLFTFINHRKEKPAEPGKSYIKQFRTPGGDAQWYHSAIYLWVDKSKQAKVAERDIDGSTIKCPNEFKTLRLHTEKNSLGPHPRNLNVDFIWYYDEEGNQVSYFDWDAATTMLLEFLQTGGENNKTMSAAERKSLREVCDISRSDGKFTSKVLGLEDVNPTTMGAAIRRDPELMKKLQHELHIATYPVLARPEIAENGYPIPVSAEEQARRKKERDKEKKETEEAPKG